MSTPTRQRSLRERLHGIGNIGIPWQGRKSKTFHSKEEQALAECETKSTSLDSRSCDPIPSTDEENANASSKDANTDTKENNLEMSSSSTSKGPLTTSQKSEEKPSTPKEHQVEKKLLNRSFTQPKGTEEYQVKASDTLASVAARFDTTPSELAKLNRLTARMIFPGQLLFVPEKHSSGNRDSPTEIGNGSSRVNQDEQNNLSQEVSGNQGNSKLGVEDNSTIPRRKVSVTDALRIPYRRHSDRLQRFLKVKSRHFTDGQGVVAGVLIITPNAVMFDPNVSDPLVIEHGVESYGVIAPLDMVMRTAIYFDIAHMKVKDAPDTPLNIPKPDIYYGKMNALSGGSSRKSSVQMSKIGFEHSTSDEHDAQNSRNKTTNLDEKTSETSNLTQKTKSQLTPQTSKSSDALAPTSSDQGPKSKTEGEKKRELSRECSLDKEVSDAFANQEAVRKTAPTTPNNSVDSPTPPLSAGSAVTEDKHESRRERMLKRLSYPMESITSYTQSSLSRILSSSPKTFVDGLFVKTSEEEKNKNGLNEEDEEKATKEEEPCQKKGAQENNSKQISENRLTATLSNPISSQTTRVENDKNQNSKSQPSSNIGYKNLVEEKPEVFETLDKLLRQNAAQEQEGPPLYLCLRMGHPKVKRTQMTPILSYGKKKAKSEYWFSIPHNRVEDLYNFLQQWFPHLYGDVDEKNAEELGFDPIDDSAEEVEEEEEKNEEGEEMEEGEEEKNSTPMSFLKLVEDHFGFRSISPTDWEVLSMGESDRISFSDLELPLPELLSPSEIFEEDHVKELCVLLPARAVGYPWTLIFSTSSNGFNLKTLYRLSATYETPVILSIKDIENAVFGAILTTPLRPSDHFYGSGESLLYTFHPEFKVFRWTGSNMYFVKGDANSLAIGAGEGEFGLWVDGDINHGRSQKCLTFDNDVLSASSDFIVKTLEVWGFV